MSKRKGDYITVDDLINEVGKDATRFIMLNRSSDVELDFDFDNIIEKSKHRLVKIIITGKNENNYFLNLLILVMIKIELYKSLMVLGLTLQATLHITKIN